MKQKEKVKPIRCESCGKPVTAGRMVNGRIVHDQHDCIAKAERRKSV